jgi:nitrogen fixation protein FixH
MTTSAASAGLSADRPGWTLRGRHVALTFVAFFGVIFAVNGYFLYSALSTYTGIIASEPYRKGLEYNKRIEAAEQQAGLGWVDAVEALHNMPIVFSLRDRNGQPVTGLHLRGIIGRPSTARADKPLAFRETQPGRYAANVGKLDDGNWMLSIEALSASSDTVVYRARKRLWLKP